VPEVHAGSVAQLGILGVLAAHGGSVGATSVFGGQALGYDPHDAIGRLFGTDLGASLGFGGLGMRGAGRGGGGDAWGTIGVGKLNTGDGAAGAPGRGTLSRLTRKERVPQLRVGEVVANGSLSKEIIRRVIHRNLAQVRACYEQGLSSRPELAGRVSIRFMIAPSGSVQQALVGESSLGSAEVEACLARAVRRWSFPAPEGGGYVTVSYPFLFERAGP
jgi:TonB family protein